MGLKEELLEIKGLKVFTNEPMKTKTTLKTGGETELFLEVYDLLSIKRCVEILQRYNFPYKFIGNGSNLLVSDKGYNGCIIQAVGLDRIYLENGVLKAFSFAKLNNLIDFAKDNRLTGLEGLFGIPATVGGGVIMNCGAFGHNISDFLLSVCLIKDGKLVVVDKDDCNFGYRKSIFLNSNNFISYVTFRLEIEEQQIINQKINYYKGLRNSIQPKGNTCGSVFKNTKKYSAGQLIDMAGLKGYSCGGATISNKHANFIITTENATSSDIYCLIQYVKKVVYDKFDILLSEEVEYVGEF